MKKCYSCEKMTDEDWTCETCEEIVCEDCTMPYTQFNQMTATQCQLCGEFQQDEAGAEYFRDKKLNEEKEAEEQQKKNHRNKSAKIHYHTPEQVAKRNTKKEARIAFHQKQDEKFKSLLSNILKPFQ